MKNRLFYGADEPNVLRLIDADKIRSEELRTIVLVPDQYKLEMEQKLGEKFGGALLHISVMSFAGLAKRVCAFEDVVPITALGRQMFVSAALDIKRDELRAFGRNRNKTGFIEELGAILSEMTAPIEIADVQSDALADKIADINTVFEMYSEISKGGYVGDENLMVLAAELAADSEIIKNSKFYISKYTYFTDSERALFGALLDCSRGVDMTLHYAEGERVFAYTGRLFDAMPSNIVAEPEARVRASVSDADVAVRDDNFKIFANAVFRQDEAELAKLLVGRVGSDAGGEIRYTGSFVEVYEAANRKDEMLFAAAEIRKMLAMGAKPSEITIVCPSLDKYIGMIELAMDAYDLPYFIDADRAFPRTPLRRFVDALLDYSASASAASVQKLLATELLPFTEQQTNQLLLDITEKRFEPTHSVPRGHRATSDTTPVGRTATSDTTPVDCTATSDTASGDRTAASHTRSDSARFKLHEQLRQMLRVLSLRHIIHSGEVELHTFVRELYAVLTKELAVDRAAQSDPHSADSVSRAAPHSIMSQCEQHSYKLRRLSGETSLEVEFGARIWNDFVAMLEQLNELAARVHSAPLARLRAMISTQMSKATVARIPSRAEYITVAPADRVRPERSKYVLLVGAVRGELPKISVKTRVLSLDEQNALLNAGGVRRFRAFEDPEREAYSLYCLLTAPREKLIITYPDAARSAILNIVLSAMENAANPDGARELRFPSARFARAKTLQNLNTTSSAPPSATPASAENTSPFRPQYPERDTLQRLLERGGPDAAGSAPETLRVRLSSSAIDEYLNCPYKYMLNRLLKANALDIDELNSKEAGNIIHSVLERYARENWIDFERPVSSPDAAAGTYAASVVAELSAKTDRVKSRVRELLDSVQKAGMDTALYRERFIDAITEYICALEYQLAMGRYTVAECEMEVTFTQQLENVFDGKRGIIDFTGKIDRVDFSIDGEYYRLIDYKSGKDEINIEKFFSLKYTQLLLYMYALSFAGAELSQNPNKHSAFEGKKCAGVYIFSANDRKNTLQDESGFAGEAATNCFSIEMAKNYRLGGISLLEEGAACAMNAHAGSGDTVYDGFDIFEDEKKRKKFAFKTGDPTDDPSASPKEPRPQLELYSAAVADADKKYPQQKPYKEYLSMIGMTAYAAIKDKHDAVEDAVIAEFSKKIIHTVAGGILRCEFEICAGDHCKYCDYTAFCLKGGGENADDEEGGKSDAGA